MFAVVWEFVVAPESQEPFERAYGPEGDWARLFAQSPGYRGTELLRDGDRPLRFLTIDRWDSEERYEAMLAARGDEYARLDAICEGMTTQETRLGAFRCC